MNLLRPDDLQYFAYGIFSQASVAHRVTIVDLDGDGIGEVIAPYGNGIVIYESDGVGGFSFENYYDLSIRS